MKINSFGVSTLKKPIPGFSEIVIRGIVFVILISFAVSILYPLFWLFINALRTNQELFLDTWGMPKDWLWGNFTKAWNFGVGRYFFNSIIVTFISTIFTILISAFAAFPLSRFNFRGRYVILMGIISGLMLTPQGSLISLYKLLQFLGIYNTYFALIIPYIAYRVPFVTFLIWSYFISLPKEIEESAYMDGCTDWQVFWQIIMPMSKPIIATAALLSSRVFWNEFMFALVFVEKETLKTIPVGLMNLKSNLATEWTVLLAGLATSALPIIIVFLLLQKHFIRGLTIGGVKG